MKLDREPSFSIIISSVYCPITGQLEGWVLVTFLQMFVRAVMQSAETAFTAPEIYKEYHQAQFIRMRVKLMIQTEWNQG